MAISRKVGPAALALAVLGACLGARAAEPDKLLPADSQAVLVVNVRQLLNSPLVKQYGAEKMKDELNKNAQAREALAAAGLDPFKDVESITVAGAASLGGKKEESGTVIVRGRFDPTKIRATVEKYAKDNKDLKIQSKGGTPEVYEVTGKDGKPMYATFADNNTLVITPAEDQARKATSGGELNAELRKALTKVGGKESLYFALAVTDEMKGKMAENPKMKELAPKMESVTGGVTVTDGVDAKVSVHTTDAKAARQVQAMVKTYLPLAGAMAGLAANSSGAPDSEQLTATLQDLIRRIDVKTAEGTVDISLTVDHKTLEELGSAAKDKDAKDKAPKEKGSKDR